MKVGYARCSTVEQKASFAAQKEMLAKDGCEKIFAEEISAVAKSRPEYEEMMRFVREGDTLIVTSLDRLARSLADLVDINGKLSARNVGLRVLNNSAIDTTSANGRLMFAVISAIGQFERELLLERQKCGIAAAKAAGKYKGRAPTAQKRAAEVIALRSQGKSMAAISKELGIGVGSVHRIVNAGAGEIHTASCDAV